jgi:hypothetical protein
LWRTVWTGRGRGTAFVATLIGSTILDWLDGYLGRQFGESGCRGRVDIEIDSWLTLSTALAAVRLGRLPWVCLLPPLARYPVAPGTAADHRTWQKVAGRAQMAVLMCALSPWPPPRPVAVGVACVQLTALLRVSARRRAARRAAVDWRQGPTGDRRHPEDKAV